MKSLLFILLAGLSLALVAYGLPSPPVDEGVDAIEQVELVPDNSAEEFPGDWDESFEEAPSDSSLRASVPEPTTALLVGILGFAIMLRRRA